MHIMITVEKYSWASKANWDDFVKACKNNHFMFYRDYMEYHSDRFEDSSLIFRAEDGTICGLLPANINKDVLYSHQGLTFGGLLLSKKSTTRMVCDIFEALLRYSESSKIKKLVYKPIPYIYALTPAQEDLYALTTSQAKLIRRDVSSSIDLRLPVKYSKGRKWAVNKAKKEGVEVVESSDYSSFWQLLERVLKSHHDAKPAHTLTEINYLHSHFPNNIRLFLAMYKNQIVAGSVIYQTSLVAHTQYLANSERGRELGALDLILDTLIRSVYKDQNFFDFGISTENNGFLLNVGLIAQKEGFGATAVVHDFYELII